MPFFMKWTRMLTLLTAIILLNILFFMSVKSSDQVMFLFQHNLTKRGLNSVVVVAWVWPLASMVQVKARHYWVE
jgi:hypothetical protein